MTLQNVTVIIPAHKRPERLRRLLDSYSRTDIKVSFWRYQNYWQPRKVIRLEDAFSFICSISDMPKDTAEISGKRKIMEFTHKHPLLRWVNRLADWRYTQKGLKAVQGMQSYPCTFSTPEKEEIIKAIEQS